MTDNRSNIAGNYYTCPVPEIPVWLDEGALTVTSNVMDRWGRTDTGITAAAGVYEGAWVQLSEDTGCTFPLTFGIPVVAKPVDSKALTIFQIVNIEPAENTPATTGAADTLAKRLAGKFLRKARVRVYGGITGVVKASVKMDGSASCTAGEFAKLKLNITGWATVSNNMPLSIVASGGVGVIPFHACPQGSDNDLNSCLVGVYAQITSATGD